MLAVSSILLAAYVLALCVQCSPLTFTSPLLLPQNTTNFTSSSLLNTSLSVPPPPWTDTETYYTITFSNYDLPITTIVHFRHFLAKINSDLDRALQTLASGDQRWAWPLHRAIFRSPDDDDTLNLQLWQTEPPGPEGRRFAQLDLYQSYSVLKALRRWVEEPPRELDFIPCADLTIRLLVTKEVISKGKITYDPVPDDEAVGDENAEGGLSVIADNVDAPYNETGGGRGTSTLGPILVA